MILNKVMKNTIVDNIVSSTTNPAQKSPLHHLLCLFATSVVENNVELYKNCEGLLDFWRKSTSLDEQIKQSKTVHQEILQLCTYASYMEQFDETSVNIEKQWFNWKQKNNDISLGFDLFFLPKMSFGVYTLKYEPEKAFEMFKEFVLVSENSNKGVVKDFIDQNHWVFEHMFQALIYLPYNKEQEAFVKQKMFSIFPKSFTKPNQFFMHASPVYLWDEPWANSLNTIRIAMQKQKKQDVLKTVATHWIAANDVPKNVRLVSQKAVITEIQKMCLKDTSCIESIVTSLSVEPSRAQRKKLLRMCVMSFEDALEQSLPPKVMKNLVPYWIENKSAFKYLNNEFNELFYRVEKFCKIIDNVNKNFGDKETDKAFEKALTDPMVANRWIDMFRKSSLSEIEKNINKSNMSDKTKGFLQCCLLTAGYNVKAPQISLMFKFKNNEGEIETSMYESDYKNLQMLEQHVEKARLFNVISSYVETASASKPRKI